MKARFVISLLFGLALAVVSAASCDKGADDDGIILGGGTQVPGTPSGPSASRERGMEIPALKPGNLFVQHRVALGGDSVVNYSYEFDPAKNHTRWIAFRFDDRTRGKVSSRSDAWADDPALPPSCRIGTETFPGYSRGHLCASADRLFSDEANRQTFYMSNMSPQRSNFNSGLWLAFEGLVQQKGRQASFADTLYVVKGGTIDDEQTIGDLQRSNGLFVAIPKYYWMALLKVKSGTYEAIAFWMEHRNYSAGANASRAVMASFAITIDELEQKTGIDFFPALPDKAEAVVESQFTLSSWGL